MTKSTKVAVAGFLGVMALSFTLTQGCGQAFKLEEKVPVAESLSIEPAPSPTPTISPLVIDNPAQFTGKVRLARSDSQDFNIFTSSLDPAIQQSVNSAFQRLLVYSPGFDSKLSWYNKGWAYSSLYGIPVAEANAANDSYILRDAAGNRLYVANNIYAANLMDANFRSAWIEKTRTTLNKGYRGLFIDDVNLSLKFFDAQGSLAIASTSGTIVSLTNWQSSVALFTETIQTQFPNIEIVHSSDWSADVQNGFLSLAQTRVINSAQFQMLKAGVNDPLLAGGTMGTYTLEQQLKYIERVHALNKSIILGGVPANLAEKEYATAYFMLFNNGKDFLFDNTVDPNSLWAGYTVDLGTPTTAIVRSGSTFTRQFNRGYVMVNEPSGNNQKLSSGDFKNLRGVTLEWTVPAKSGLILVPVQ